MDFTFKLYSKIIFEFVKSDFISMAIVLFQPMGVSQSRRYNLCCQYIHGPGISGNFMKNICTKCSKSGCGICNVDETFCKEV